MVSHRGTDLQFPSTLAWKIPWAEDPGRLQSWGLEELDTTEQLHFTSMILCMLSCTDWVFVYLLWSNVYYDSLTIFN